MATLSKLLVELGLDANQFNDGIDKAEGKASGFGSKLGKIFAVGAAGVAVAAVGIGATLFKIGDSYDSMSDGIAIKTGATGKQLDALNQSAINVFKSVPTSMAIAGDALASLRTKTGDTGKTLEGLTASEIELARVTGTDLNSNIEASAKVFNQFGVSAKDQTKTLDQLFNVSQKTGVGIDQLMQETVAFGPILKNMGLTAGQSANLIGKMDQAGLHTAKDIKGMNQAIVTGAKAGMDAKTSISTYAKAILGAGSTAEATAIASKYFGKSAGPELAAALRDGTISVDDLTGSVDANGKSILDSAKNTYDFAENFTLFKNNIEAALIPLGTLVFQGLNLLIPLLVDGSQWLGTLGPKFQGVADYVTQFAHAMTAAFDTGTPIKDLVEFLPGPLQNLEHGFLLVADAIGDVVRGFQTGGLSGALSALGPAIKQAAEGIGSIAINVAIDIASWTLGKVADLADWLDKLVGGGGATGSNSHGMDAMDRASSGVHHVTVSSLAVDILGFAVGQIADLWGWIEGLLGVGGTSTTGDGTGGPDTDKVITLSSVAVAIGGWLISKAVDIGTDIVKFLSSTAVTLAGVAVSVGSWLLNEVSDIAPPLQAWLDAHTSDVVVRVNATISFVSVNLPNLASSLFSSIVNLDTKGWGEAFGQKLATLDWGSAARGVWSALKSALDSNVGIVLLTFTNLPLLFATAIQGGATLMALKAGEFVVGFLKGLDEGFGTNVIPWLQALPGKVLAAVPEASTTLYDVGSQLIAGILTMLNNDMTYKVGPWIVAFPGWVVSQFVNMSQTLYDQGTQLIAGIMSGWTDKSNELADWAGNFGSWILGQFPNVSGSLYNIGVDLVQGIVDGITGAAGRIASAILGAIPHGSINVFGVAIPYANGGVIPGFADGGVTSSRLVMVGERGPELAMLPVGTRIYPNNETRSMMGGGVSAFGSTGGDTYQITVNVEAQPGMDANALGDAVGAGLVRHLNLRAA